MLLQDLIILKAGLVKYCASFHTKDVPVNLLKKTIVGDFSPICTWGIYMYLFY